MGQGWETFQCGASVEDVSQCGKRGRRFIVGQVSETFQCGANVGDISVWSKAGRRFSVGQAWETFQCGGRFSGWDISRWGP